MAYIPSYKKYTIAPIWVEKINHPFAYMLRWLYHGNFQNPVFTVFINGKEYKDTTDTQCVITGLKEKTSYQIDIMAFSPLESATFDLGQYFFYPPKGNKLMITIPKISLKDNPQFQSYMLYWSDDGTEPVELLKELVGANNTTFTTPALIDGVIYKFRACFKDYNGTIWPYGPTISGTVNTLPEAPVSPSVTYSTDSTVTVSGATSPAGANGIYTLQPTLYNGYNWYKHSSGNYFIWWRNYSGGEWLITNTLGNFDAGCYYKTGVTTPLPIGFVWSLYLTWTGTITTTVYNDVIVTGNPNPDCTGVYHYGGVYSAYPYYKHSTQNWWIWYYPTSTKYYISNSLGNDGTQGRWLTPANQLTAIGSYTPIISTGNVTVISGDRKAYIQATKPIPQDLDCIGYFLYSNTLDGYGLQPEIIDTYPLKFYFPSEALTYTTPELSKGDWKFAFRALDKTGYQSPYANVELNLIQSGNQIIQASLPPLKPYYIDAICIAGGLVKVTVIVSDTTGIDKINVYLDGVLDGHIPIVQKTLNYYYTTGILNNNQEYSFKASCVAGTVESAFTDSVTAKVVNQAPNGDLTLTLQMVD